MSVLSADSELPTGTLTFVFTDVEGSTRLWELVPAAMREAMARHDALIEENVARNSGHPVRPRGEGDSRFAVFARARDAVAAARDMQQALAAQPWLTPTPLRVRMALHTGEADLRAGDYYGSDVNRCARLRALAYGGQTLLSQSTHDLIRDALPANVELHDLGEHRLKDLQRPEHVYQLNIAGLPPEFPRLQSLDAFPNNLPVQLTSFVGRDQELPELKQLLTTTHLLTVTGPGGTGKTRLSLQLAAELLETFTNGVWLVELAPLADPTLIAQTVASTLGVREQPQRSILDALVDYLRAKNLLLILDNCEHLIEASAQLADALLRAAPRLKILASSREALGTAGETSYRVPSLPLPDVHAASLDALAQNDCVRLFVDRALAAYPHFRLKEKNAPAIVDICRRLDGIPLAIELAAARVAVFSPEEIASRLDDRFRLLTGGSRAAMERHQTLRALIDWSHDLLSEEERRLFRQLSVFAGGWTFEAAEAVCSDLDVLNLLTQLVNKSLVMVDADAQAEGTRYRLPETIRQYARDKLLEAGESVQVRNRHLDFFLKFAEEAEPHFNSHEEMEWMSRLESEVDNLRAALEWAMENDVEIALRLGVALHLFWSRHGYEAEGRPMLSEALARLKALPTVEGEEARQRIALKAKALNALGVLDFGHGDLLGSLKFFEESVGLARQVGEKYTLSRALSQSGLRKAFLGDAETSYPAAEEGLILAREVGDKVLLGLALINMAGVGAMTRGDPKTMRAYAEEGLQLLREAGARWDVAMTSFGMGQFAAMQGNYAEARARFEASLPLFMELGDRQRVNTVHSDLAHLERRQGHLEQAKALYRETLLEWQRLGHRAAIAHELECFAFIAKAQEQDERAARLFGAAETLRESINIPMTPFERAEYDAEVSDLRANMREAAFASAWAEGRALTMEQALALATSDQP